jgi:hypothetical protein
VGTLMESSAGHRKQIGDVRCPNIKGLPDDIVHMLHHSFVGILQMRRSIDRADFWIETGRKAAIEGLDLLARLKAQGF